MKIAFLGDIALVGKYDLQVNTDAVKRLELLADKLKTYDYVVANLETPFTEKKKSLMPKSMHLRSSCKNVEILKFLHINAVSLANNHIHDFGKQGLQDTIDCLEKNGIEWYGANSKYLIKKIGDEVIGFSGFNCYSTNGTGYIEGKRKNGVNALTFENVLNQLKTDKTNNAFSVLSFHWGSEHTNFPNYENIQFAKKISKEKNVLIHGHHPHVIQGIQQLNDSIVAYSLGNCIFDITRSITGSFTVKKNDENKKSFILEAVINDGKIKSYKTHGFKDQMDGMIFSDLETEIKDISEPLYEITDVEAYNKKRKEQIKVAVLEKFGKRDFKWLMSRLNYYSIGAKVTARFRKRKYIKGFLNHSIN